MNLQKQPTYKESVKQFIKDFKTPEALIITGFFSPLIVLMFLMAFRYGGILGVMIWAIFMTIVTISTIFIGAAASYIGCNPSKFPMGSIDKYGFDLETEEE